MIKKGLYLYCRINSVNSMIVKGGGVEKKMLSTVDVFNDHALPCRLKNLNFSSNYLIRAFCYCFSKSVFKKQVEGINFKEISYVYMRQFRPHSWALLILLQYIKRMNPECLLIYEVPTYPYEFEFSGIRHKIFMCLDKYWTNYISKYIDRVVTYSNDASLFGVETIQVINGINVSAVPTRKIGEHVSINLLAVAKFSLWHGYDRLIRGLAEYYAHNDERKIILHLVGAGSELNNYKVLVKQLALEDVVIFHGILYGKDLDAVFDMSDIGIASLGTHRSGIFLGSFLKSREYLARGLPIVASTKIDILDENYPYVLYVPEDESSIDIASIIQFHASLQEAESVEKQIKNIRQFAEANCEMSVVMKPIIDYITANSK